jgi:hypothetical protein
LSLIHAQRPAAHLEAIRLLDCVLCFTRSHIDERKSARPTGFPIVNELDGFHFAVALENRADFIFGCGEWQVANVDRRHSTNLTTERATVPNGPLARGFNMQTPTLQSRRRSPSHRPCTNFD